VCGSTTSVFAHDALEVETEPESESESVDGVDGRDVSMKAGLSVEGVF
jgi:hypothetical protein